MLKVVLVGYGQMLNSLIEGIKNSNHKIVGVLRNERRLYSPLALFFKDIFNPTMDYTLIKANKLYDINANSVNSKKFIKTIKKLKPDLIIVGSWGEKFKSEILNLIPCINFHPALLPKNRGANPYFWVIYNNQKITGLTAHFMDKNFDTGDIIMQEAITISENETGKSLKDKTTRLARNMIIEVLNQFENNQIQPIKQNETYSSYEAQISDKEKILDLNKSKEDVERHLRALCPWSCAWIRLKDNWIKVAKCQILDDTNYKNFNTYDLIEKNKKYSLIKGKDFLIKLYK